MQIRWTTLALSDLKIISVRIERQRNLATANRVCRAIYDTVQILRRFPESGKPGLKRELGSSSCRNCPTSWHTGW